MARLDWAAVEPEHYRRAVAWVAENWNGASPRLFVKNGDAKIPAKLVAATAYRLAHSLAMDAELRFSSGQGVLDRLRGAGLEVGRDEAVPSRGRGKRRAEPAS